MVEVRAPLPGDETRSRMVHVHAVMNGFVIQKSSPDSHKRTNRSRGVSECEQEQDEENRRDCKSVERVNQQLR